MLEKRRKGERKMREEIGIITLLGQGILATNEVEMRHGKPEAEKGGGREKDGERGREEKKRRRFMVVMEAGEGKK